MLISFTGILIILARGDVAHLRQITFHAAGIATILAGVVVASRAAPNRAVN